MHFKDLAACVLLFSLLAIWSVSIMVCSMCFFMFWLRSKSMDMIETYFENVGKYHMYGDGWHLY